MVSMNDTRTGITITLIPFAFAMIWLIAQFDISLNSDHAWLIESAKRLLGGQAMSEGYYDPNPPLSILLYVPSVWLEWFAGIPIKYAHYTFTALYLGLFTLALHKILKVFPTLNDAQRDIILLGFISANTFLTLSGNFYFGERDQFIFMGLIICLLVQIAMTRGHDITPLFRNLMLGISAIFILLKPHYLIIPALFILHRMITQRRFLSIFKDADVQIFITCVVGYAAIIGLFFSDYLTEIFPSFFKYYLSVDNPKAPTIAFIYISMITALGILMMISGVALERLKLAYTVSALSFLCCLLFWVQMKGIYYQLLPTLGFGFIAIGLFIHECINRYLPDFKFKPIIPLYALLGIAFLYASDRQTVLNHKDYAQTPLYKIVEQCAPNCTFFFSGENMDIAHQIAAYGGAKHASRFPSLWFLPKIVKTDDKEEKQKFAHLILEDFKKYGPEYLIVSNNLELSGIQNFNLIDYLSDNENFKTVVNTYQKIDVLNDNRNNYRSVKMPENDFEISYDIYKKRP